MLTSQPNQPLIIFVNVLNNIKEVENHFFAQDFLKAGFNIFNFDGPGQGEMHQKMRLIPDYEEAIRAIIDWFEVNNDFNIDVGRIGVMGISFGGFASIKAAALDPRIDCVVSNGGYAYFPPISPPVSVSSALAVAGRSAVALSRTRRHRPASSFRHRPVRGPGGSGHISWQQGWLVLGQQSVVAVGSPDDYCHCCSAGLVGPLLLSNAARVLAPGESGPNRVRR